VDEVARRAGVGKGTVYLYWPSKLELFGAVLTRDAARLVSDQLAAIRADPARVLPHRSMRWVFLAVMARPLSRAWSPPTSRCSASWPPRPAAAGCSPAASGTPPTGISPLLHKHGLLLDEPNPLLTHRLSAAVTGSFVLAPLTPEFDAEAQADALALTVRRGVRGRRNHPIPRRPQRRSPGSMRTGSRNYARSCHDAMVKVRLDRRSHRHGAVRQSSRRRRSASPIPAPRRRTGRAGPARWAAAEIPRSR